VLQPNKIKMIVIIKNDQHKYILILIVILAFLLRLLFVKNNSSLPYSDAAVYDNLAFSIAQGNGYVNLNGSPHSFYPPAYPFFLSMIYSLFGHSYAVVRIIQSAIGAFSILFIYLIARKYISQILSLTVSALFLMYLPFIRSAGLLLTESVFTFILLLIIFYILRTQERDSVGDYIILGLLLGVGMLTRSVMLFFPIFLAPLFLWSLKKWGKKAILNYVVMSLVFLTVVLPWTFRNYSVYRRLVPISTASGLGFYSSYCPKGGVFGLLADPNDPIMVEANKIEDAASKSSFLFKKTLRFIADNPKKVLLLEAKKAVYFWAPFDWEIVGGKWFNFIYVVIVPFFLVGLYLSFKAIKRSYPILLPIIYFQIMTLIFYGSPRFRLPIEPYIFILGAFGFQRCKEWIVRWKKEKAKR